MTVSSNYTPDKYNGDGATLAFTVSNYFLADADLRVVEKSAVGVETVKALTTHYTVAGAGDESGGTVTMLVAPASGTTLTISLAMAYTQTADYVESGPFPALTHETALDRVTLLTQQVAEMSTRALKAPTSTSIADGELVSTAVVGDSYLKINSAADGFTSISPALASVELTLGTAVTPTDGSFLVGDGSTFVGESGATVRTSLGLGTGDTPTFTNIIATGLTDGGILLGSGSGAITAMSVLADGEMIVGDGTTDPVAESGATLRTSIGIGTGDTVQITALELGHATDTTLARVGAGQVSVEGVNVVTTSSTDTLTNKTFDANGTGNSISNIDVADLADGVDGELITWGADGAPATVAAGSADQVLTSNGAGAAPTFQDASGGGGGGGKILQVIQAVKTDTFSSAADTTWADITGITASITPTSTSNKILIMVHLSVGSSGSAWQDGVELQLVRGSTAIHVGDTAGTRPRVTTGVGMDNDFLGSCYIQYLDSPSTTSATTYKVQIQSAFGYTSYLNRTGQDTNSTDYSRGASSIILMEVDGT